MEKLSSKDGSTLALQRVGSGPPLILIGGAFCDHRARAAGLPLADSLAQRFTVLCYDRRGRSESTQASPYAVARELEDLATLLDAAGGSAHVYGHSSGAVLALEGAAAGLPITTLALYEPPLVMDETRAPIPVDLVEELVALTAAGKRADAAELFLTRAIGLPPPAVEHMKRGPVWPALEALSHTLSHDATLTREPAQIVERARQVQQPALVIDGERSPAWMRAGTKRLAEALPNARYCSMPEQTHDVDPKLLAPLLLDFFASQG
jgi:pimeloyl-ACP methyl ester carboxylesterase